jgi:hypothetical protein
MIKKEPIIQFISTIPGLSSIDDCIPKPAIKFIPSWWKQTKNFPSYHHIDKAEAGNVKNCPSFMDYFSSGYILPMWADTILYYDNETKDWSWRSSDARFTYSNHNNDQYLDFVNHSFLGKESYFVFKAHAPWRIITKPGYSTYQLPVFYHFNEDFSVLPGIRDSDTYHQINPQIVIHSSKKEIFIPRGTPLAQYIPFKREKNSILVRDANDKDMIKFMKDDLNFTTKFKGSDLYIDERKK